MRVDDLRTAVDDALGDWEVGAGNVIAVLAGAAIIRYGWTLWYLLTPGDLGAVLVLLYVLGVGLGLITIGAAGVDLAAHGRAIAAFVVSVLVVTVVAVYLLGVRVTAPGPDTLLFTTYAVDLFFEGQNPFAASMGPAWERYGASPLSVTPTVDGGHVTSFSYPAMAFLVFAPQRLLGLPNYGYTLLGLTLAALLFLTVESAPEYALAPTALFLLQHMFYIAYMGVNDIVWVLPVLLAMRAWSRQRWRGAAVWMGLASAAKQQAWLITPFLAIWLLNDSATTQEFVERARTCLAWGLAAFLAPNLPFILWHPRAWLLSVLTPLGGATSADLVHQGVGLTVLTVSGQVLLPKWTYTVFVALVGVTTLLAYAIYWDRLTWAGWVLPVFVLAVHYRSLLSYFIYFLPIAYYATLLAYDLDEPPQLTVADVQEVFGRAPS